MAKVGNLQSGYKGKLDGQTYYKGADGKTVVRKITVPKNPKTLQQRVQRVITKTVGANYKAMKAICDHSFEGKSMGFECANRFRQLNANRMRERAAYLQEQGISLSEYFNFLKQGDVPFSPAAVFVSEGSLNQVYVSIAGGLAKVAVGGNTYADVINALGAQRGDQMTFVTVEKNTNDKYIFHYARVILDPRNENGAAALSSAFVTASAIVNPNSRNKGTFGALAVVGTDLQFKLDASGVVVAAGIIMSRRSGDKWFRSTCQLTISETALGSDATSLLAAAQESGEVVQLDLDSEAFLNNAGIGGSEGASAPASGGESGNTNPIINNTARVNGASQSRLGTVNVTTLSSIELEGQNLADFGVKLTKNGSGDTQPTSQTETAISFTGITGATVGDTYRVVATEGGLTLITISIVDDNNGLNEG